MGAGIHGGFGATKGSVKLYKDIYAKSKEQNYTREQLINFLDGKTKQSSIIADKIRKGEIKISVLGDKFFEDVFGVNKDVVGIAIDNKIYVRKNSNTIHSDIVHEGTHAVDYLSGLSYDKISSWNGEIKAFTAEHHFQKASGLKLQFDSENEIKIHVMNNYKKKGRK
ncbi:hypothetical protein [uncultured Eubacterium sp.]|uniref:hypothetical protein n=1 Tax=uncultured Eubacterium sp. TaxID=165185 RepID=UPI0025977F04|nr:hypothetical protein [uncultured Eubacterium sp.]